MEKACILALDTQRYIYNACPALFTSGIFYIDSNGRKPNFASLARDTIILEQVLFFQQHLQTGQKIFIERSHYFLFYSETKALVIRRLKTLPAIHHQVLRTRKLRFSRHLVCVLSQYIMLFLFCFRQQFEF